MPKYEITFNTDAEYATCEVDAPNPKSAMEEAHRIKDEDPDSLLWENYQGNSFEIHAIILHDEEGNELNEWVSEEQLLRNAAADMFAALEEVVREYSADTPDTNGCEEPSIEKARAAIAKAKGEA